MNEQPTKRTWTVELERLGGDQIIRIPGEIALPGDQAVLRRDGDSVVIEAAGGKSFANVLEYLRSVPPITDEFPEIDDPPPEGVKL